MDKINEFHSCNFRKLQGHLRNPPTIYPTIITVRYIERVVAEREREERD